MFWRRIEQDLAERLRVAIEFATLGAYELLGEESSAEPAREQVEAGKVAAPPCASAPWEIRAHVGRSNVPCARADGQLVPPACPQLDEEPDGGYPKRPTRPNRSNRRGGAIRPAQQPCTWAGR
jgi:hypothetical protein